MKRLSDHIIHFLQHQHFVVVSTIGKGGFPHNACKGIVKIEPNGKVYLLDLYKERTYENLKSNPRISITAIDEHKFKGYCLQGRARLMRADKIKSHLIKAWEGKITSRVTHRILKNIKGEKGHPKHPEALLPKPEYLIIMEVEKITNLTPHPLKT